MVSGAILTPTWYRVAYTQTGSLAIMYLNGVQSVNGTAELTIRNVNRTKNLLGNINWSAYAPSNADFDKVKIWNRVLTAAGVLADKNYKRSYVYTL
jgi:hypothetical protein